MSDDITTTEAAPVAATETATEAPVEAQASDGQGEAPEGAEAPEASEQQQSNKLLAALLRKRSKLKAENARLAQERADFERTQREATARLSAAERFEQLVARAREADEDALRELGIDYDKITMSRLRRGTPEEKLSNLQQQLEAERKARLAREREMEEAAQRAASERAVGQFVALVQGGKYPETAMYQPHEIAEAGNAIADELAASRGGRYPGFDEIAAELESRLAAKHARIRGQQSAPAPAKRTSPTLSSRDSGERSRAPKALTEEERMAAISRWVAESWKVG